MENIEVGQTYFNESNSKYFKIENIDKDGWVSIVTEGEKKSISNNEIIEPAEFNRYVRMGVFVLKNKASNIVLTKEKMAKGGNTKHKKDWTCGVECWFTNEMF